MSKWHGGKGSNRRKENLSKIDQNWPWESPLERRVRLEQEAKAKMDIIAALDDLGELGISHQDVYEHTTAHVHEKGWTDDK